jgi:DNA-binding transcriptional regulator LsrR (DeoR family)
VNVAKEIVDFMLEDDEDVRRERAAFVARLRDKHGLKYRQIGRHLNVSRQRAHRIYSRFRSTGNDG